MASPGEAASKSSNKRSLSRELVAASLAKPPDDTSQRNAAGGRNCALEGAPALALGARSKRSAEDEMRKYLADFEELLQDREAAKQLPEEKPPAGCEHKTELRDDTGEVCVRCCLVIRSFSDMPLEFEHRIRKRRLVAEETWVGDSSGDEGGDGNLGDVHDVEANCGDKVEAVAVAGRGLDTISELAEGMHPHQRHGFHFLWRNLGGNAAFGQEAGGCILAHSPGSGKTFLVICFLKSYFQLHPNSRPLIVAPKSMLRIWEREFRKWKVGIPCYTLSLKDKASAEFKQKFLGQPGRHVNRYAVLQKWKRTPSVLAVNYESLLKLVDDTAVLKGLARENRNLLINRTDVLILDEGHNIRNKGIKRRAILQFRTKLRILLSGTLFQNNVEELRNLCYVVRPDCLGGGCGKQEKTEVIHTVSDDDDDDEGRYGYGSTWSLKEPPRDDKLMEKTFDRRCKEMFPCLFKKDASVRRQGKDDEIRRWQKLTDPFVDYFDGKELLKSLPSFYEYVFLVNPNQKQREILDRYQQQGRPASDLEAHMKIGNICIHPILHQNLDGDERREAYGKANPEDGVKTDIIMKLVGQFVKLQERVLIFCLQVEPLFLLKSMMERQFGWAMMREIVMVHGKMDSEDRLMHMDCFNHVGNQVKVMLASTKACGEGVSLVGASRVIHLGVEWNPSVNKQANCRAYRWEQKRDVHVYRLLARDTIEEDRYDAAISKYQLGKKILVPANERRRAAGAARREQSVVRGELDDSVLERLTSRDKTRSISQILKRLEEPTGDSVEHQVIYSVPQLEDRAERGKKRKPVKDTAEHQVICSVPQLEDRADKKRMHVKDRAEHQVIHKVICSVPQLEDRADKKRMHVKDRAEHQVIHSGPQLEDRAEGDKKSKPVEDTAERNKRRKAAVHNSSQQKVPRPRGRPRKERAPQEDRATFQLRRVQVPRDVMHQGRWFRGLDSKRIVTNVPTYVPVYAQAYAQAYAPTYAPTYVPKWTAPRPRPRPASQAVIRLERISSESSKYSESSQDDESSESSSTTSSDESAVRRVGATVRYSG